MAAEVERTICLMAIAEVVVLMDVQRRMQGTAQQENDEAFGQG